MNRLKFAPMDEAHEEGAAGGGGQPPEGGTGAGSADWREQIPEELRDNPTIKNTKDVAGLASQLVNAQKMLGNAVRIPGKDAGDDDWNSFYEKLEQVPGVTRLPSDPREDQDGVVGTLRKMGLPESPDKYQINLPDGVDPESPAVKQQLEFMHQLGVLPDKAQQYIDYLIESERETLSGAEAVQRQAQQALQETFGDGLERVQHQSLEAVRQLGGDEFAQALQEQGFLNDPAWLGFFNNAAQLAKESGIVFADGPSDGGLTPAEAKARINEIWNNPQHPYHHVNHPDHRRAVDEYLELHRAAPRKRG